MSIVRGAVDIQDVSGVDSTPPSEPKIVVPRIKYLNLGVLTT